MYSVLPSAVVVRPPRTRLRSESWYRHTRMSELTCIGPQTRKAHRRLAWLLCSLSSPSCVGGVRCHQRRQRPHRTSGLSR
eukprot:2273935-Rhodomonas_salina.10